MKSENSRWPCPACGAAMNYNPAARQLVCGHCGHTEVLEAPPEADRRQALQEHPLLPALNGRLPQAAMEEVQISKCPGCGADLELEGLVSATTCPFCATPVMPGGPPQRLIRPQAVIPFRIPEREARERMAKWLGSLWFAPNGLTQFARKGRLLTGIYVPFWTFDSDTRSSYSGMRGDAYYVTETVTVMVDGKPQRQQRQVRKIRWSRASGRVARFFDDVLVIGSQSLPREHTEALAPWDLGGLEPFRKDYLSGFQAEAYGVALEQGHGRAREIMSGQIAMDVRRDIGGDEQRIERIDTDWSEETFKHILLPVWTAAYKYNGKSYRYVVNGQTGKVKGERPYSVWKILFAVLFALILFGLIAVVSEGRY